MITVDLAANAERVRTHLQAAIGQLPESRVRDAMTYACEGGKGIRGFLVVEAARLHGITGTAPLRVAAAIEAMHAYSLIHDDLPAMDDDDLRRGRATVHKVWDEATAVLAGDALQAMAFEILTSPATIHSALIRADLAVTLARAAGGAGMVLGQALDIAAETAGRPLRLDEIVALQGAKTGALIRWSAEAGARLAGGDPMPLGAYARALGLAFQIADDLLDATGDPEKAGKRLHKDTEAGKATFVGLLGVEGARARAAELVEEACVALAPYGAAALTLQSVARFVISRER